MAKQQRIIDVQKFQTLLDNNDVSNSSEAISEFIKEKLKNHPTLSEGPKKSTITNIMKPGKNHSINDHNLMCIAVAFGIAPENRMWLCSPTGETGSTITVITLDPNPTVVTETPQNPDISAAPPKPGSTDPKVQKLTAEIQQRIDQLDAQVYLQICQMQEFVKSGPFHTRSEFVRTLVEHCEVEPALFALIRAAEDSQRSSHPSSLNSSSRLLAEVRDRLIPLTWGKDFATRMLAQMKENGVNLVEGVVQHQTIADVMMSGYDVRPIDVDESGLGKAAMPTCQLPNSGGGSDNVLRGACEFLQHLETQFSSRFLRNHRISSVNSTPTYDEATLKQLASHLDSFVTAQSKIRDRTIYAVVHFPIDPQERKFLRQVITMICQHVKHLVFVEVMENPTPDNSLEVSIRTCLFSIKVD
jgi:Arc/MetJ-type ribon-helix-helix transcriptional regulator